VSQVFLDTVGLLAIWDETDQWHHLATAAYAEIEKQHSVLITTSFVLLECGNAASKRSYRSAVDRLRGALDAANCIVRPTENDWEAAWHAYVRNEGAGAGIVDQVSFIVMRRLGIQKAFTHNSHFLSAGFETMF
jgi:uncharacterized protein